MPRRSSYEEDEYQGYSGGAGTSSRGRSNYGRGYEEEGGEYGSSRRGRSRHEPREVELYNRRAGALKGWGEDPEEVLGPPPEGDWRFNPRGYNERRSSSSRGRGGYEEEEGRYSSGSRSGNRGYGEEEYTSRRRRY